MAKGFLNKIDHYGYLRPMVYFLKSIFRNPFQLIREILIDLKKDIKTDSKIKKPIICFGLPKSGSTMIEEILSLNDVLMQHGVSLEGFHICQKMKTHTEYQKIF